MMASVSEQLLAALDDLDTEKLKRFKWHLKNYYSVSAAALEKADAPDTVDLMIKRFGPEEAVKITVEILRKIDQNYLAEELEKKHKQAQAENSFEDPDPVGAQSKPINDARPSDLNGYGDLGSVFKIFAFVLETFCKEELKKISDRVTFTNIVPRTRNDFLQYSHQLTLDLNTVNKHLRLSERNRVITATGTAQSYPDHPDRFDVCQVLCRESVCGRCFWELEWSGDVCISVSYKSISRKCWSGSNDQSWSLFCSPDSYSFIHNNKHTDLPVKPIIRRIGVFVDHSAGTLSFYSVSRNTMSLIHTVQTTFTQPLYPGFWVYYSGSSVKLC